MRLNIKFKTNSTSPNDVDELMDMARHYPGECYLVFHLPNNGHLKSMRVMAHNIKIATEKEFIRKLRKKYGKDNVWVE
jgi:hypothetical protein